MIHFTFSHNAPWCTMEKGAPRIWVQIWIAFPDHPEFFDGESFFTVQNPYKKSFARFWPRARARGFFEIFKKISKKISLQNRKTNASWRFLRAPWTSYDALHNFTARPRNSAHVFNFFERALKNLMRALKFSRGALEFQSSLKNFWGREFRLRTLRKLGVLFPRATFGCPLSPYGDFLY